MWMSIVVVASTLLIGTLFALPSKHRPSTGKASVQVVVLGDIGRSPRMQYHALSIANCGGRVDLIGYLDTPPLGELQAHPKVTIRALRTNPKFLQTSNRSLFLLFGPLKVIYQVLSLWWVLAYEISASRWMLVQNPPSIPTLVVAAICCYMRKTKLIIDWHNFGYTILAMKLGDSHPLVNISYFYEFFFALFAEAHLTVTKAMVPIIQDQLGLEAKLLTLHDRPSRIFQPISQEQKFAFLQKYNTLAEHYNSIAEERARLLVSSTSWTPDEDFSLLLDALCGYSRSATSTDPHLPELVVIITGKGPQHAYYKERISSLIRGGLLEMVHIYTDWLTFEDYASLLGSADLGVSLHTSSSGVDLPMKVVDMFGTGLPVLGWSKFEAWSELVTEDVNGKGFESSEQMSSILCELFGGVNVLPKLKEGALLESRRRWDDEWKPVAGKLLDLTS